jgi:hypothetical protein
MPPQGDNAAMDNELNTYFHLPGTPPYKPGEQSRGGASIPNQCVSLPTGTPVTLHGIPGVYRVVSSHFHWGHPDEDPGMHIFLEKA